MTVAAHSRADIYDAIRAAGGRITQPTRIVVDILEGNDAHPSADDLIVELARRAPGVAPSTVYRVLQRLDQLEIVEHIHSGSGPAFYHLRHRGHAHLVCEVCTAVTDIPEHVLDAVAATARRDHGFAVRIRHAALLGRCAACSAHSVEVDEQAGPRLVPHVAADVAVAGGVLGEQDRTRAEQARAAVADFDLHRTGEVDDELATRCAVEVDRVVAVDLAELHAGTRPQLGDPTHGAEVGELDVEVLEMGLAIVTGEDTHELHVPTR